MKLKGVDEALKLISEGDTITISGMSIHRNPMSFISSLIKSGIRNLSFIDREPGLGLEVLIKNHVLKKVRVAMAIMEWIGTPPNFRRAAEKGEIEVIEDVCGAFMAGIRAGAFGVPFMPVRGIIGSDLVRIHEAINSWKVIRDPFTGDEILTVKAIKPDVAIIHVHKADPEGNAEILGPIYEDVLKAKAARKVIITTEEVVSTDYFKGREPTISGYYVDAVIKSPKGAYPTSMYGLYEPDYEKIWEMVFE